jgi:hypothetical protein
MTVDNRLDKPCGKCQWRRGCDQPAPYSVCLVDAMTGDTLTEGWVDGNFCAPHARAMLARIGQSETYF